jgi:hypothetical protein
MKKLTIALIVLIVVTIVCGGMAGWFYTKMSNLQTENMVLSGRLTTANEKVEMLTGERDIANGKVEKLTGELGTATENVTRLTRELGTATENVTRLTGELAIANATAANVSALLTYFQSKLLRDPTAKEAFAFIDLDNTNEIFTIDLGYPLVMIVTIENAAKKGLRAYWVVAQLAGGVGYSFVGFKTTDEDWIYFLANTDIPVKLVVGKHYWIINRLHHPEYDDTIVSIHYLPIPSYLYLPPIPSYLPPIP